jgi:DNA-binding FadR family transcriptional regulator
MDQAREDLAAMTTMMVSVGDISIGAFAECRLELECLCARIAALHRTDDDLEKLAAEIENQRDINLTDEQFCATDVRFHRGLVDATKNELLMFLMSGVVEALQPISNLIVFRFRERKEIVSQHQRILEFLARRDGEGAANVLIEQARYLNSHYSNAIAAREKRAAGSGSQAAEA